VAEVKECCDRGDGYFVVLNDKVIDVEGFTHPGPQSLVTRNVGKDITAMFVNQGHSMAAWEQGERRVIGVIKTKSGKLQSNSYASLSPEEIALHKRIDQQMDFSKPLIPQVKKLSNREFRALISRPRYAEGRDDIQMFEDPSDDASEKTYFSTNLKVVAPIIVLLVCVAYATAESPTHFARTAVVSLPVGVAFLWTAIEYIFHRFLLHRELNLDNDAAADGEHLARIFANHLHHHVFCNQRYRIVLSLKTIATYAIPITTTAFLFLPTTSVSLLAAGGLAGCLGYDALHLAFHFDDVLPPWIMNLKYFASMRSAHMRHHFRDNAREFGVTSAMWDDALGTPRFKAKAA